MKLVRRLSPGVYLVSQHLTTVNGVYYYNRKYPADLRHRFAGKVRKKVSLKTRDEGVAARKADQMATEDDALWNAMRGNPELPVPEIRKAAKSLIAEYNPSEQREENPSKPGEFAIWSKASVLDEMLEGDSLHRGLIHEEAHRILEGNKSIPLLSEALEVYLKEHKNSDNKQFEKVTRYGLDLVFSMLGDRPMDAYDREEVREWRDNIVSTTKNKKTTIRRRLDAINVVFRKGCVEFQLMLPNPFANLNIPGEGLDSEGRHPFTESELLAIRAGVLSRDDDIRWIVGLLIETGARAGEVIGLRSSDLKLSAPVPNVQFRWHEKLGRRLKNKNSERDVPLVGVSLWAARRAIEASPDGWLFPRYASDGNIKATHAENTINKWLKKLAGKTSHSFRHALLDRLRDNGCPLDAAQQAVGHGPQTITRGYGKGYSLEKLRGYLEAAMLPDD
jgi:integrase